MCFVLEFTLQTQISTFFLIYCRATEDVYIVTVSVVLVWLHIIRFSFS